VGLLNWVAIVIIKFTSEAFLLYYLSLGLFTLVAPAKLYILINCYSLVYFSAGLTACARVVKGTPPRRQTCNTPFINCSHLSNGLQPLNLIRRFGPIDQLVR